MYDGNYLGCLDQLDEPLSVDDTELGLIKGICLVLTGQETGSVLLNEFVDMPPDNPSWQSDLALALLLLGKTGDALRLLQELVDKGTADAVAYGRLGAVHLSNNDLEASCISYQEAIHREPGRAEWHSNLAGILVRQQKLAEALENYEIAIRLNPDLQKTERSRQNVLIALEKTDELIDDLLKKIDHNPDDYTLKLKLARAYNLDNRPAEAIKLLRRELIPIKDIEIPDTDNQNEGPVSIASETYAIQFQYRLLLSEIFSARSLYNRALALLIQLEKMVPDNPVPIICRQAQVLSEMGQHDPALEKLEALAETNPDNNAIKTAKAGVLCEKGNYEQAEGILRSLLDIYPGNAALLSQLGQTLLWVGDLDEAADCFEKAAAFNPQAFANMVTARRIPDDPKILDMMKTFAENLFLPDVARENMAYALANVYERQQDYDTAFRFFAQANKLADKGLTYDSNSFTRKTRAVQRVFTLRFFKHIPPLRPCDRTPIFVVGMPRSGTTLTEQILCSHPDIFGAGELLFIPKLTGLLPKVLKARYAFPWCVGKMTPHLREEAARYYLYNLYEFDRHHPYVVDKMPHNFVNLGLIAMIFPKAKIIHVNRDPRDNAVSNFQQNFKARHGGMGFAFNLKNIALQINDYHGLMNHWRQNLPLPIFDLSYEAMVGDMEGSAKQLLDFVGVDWHEDVTRFYETKRAVKTASLTQVRQPIYMTSVKKWKRYEHHLGALLDHLDPAVTKRYDEPTPETNPYENRIVLLGNATRL